MKLVWCAAALKLLCFGDLKYFWLQSNSSPNWISHLFISYILSLVQWGRSCYMLSFSLLPSYVSVSLFLTHLNYQTLWTLFRKRCDMAERFCIPLVSLYVFYTSSSSSWNKSNTVDILSALCFLLSKRQSLFMKINDWEYSKRKRLHYGCVNLFNKYYTAIDIVEILTQHI